MEKKEFEELVKRFDEAYKFLYGKASPDCLMVFGERIAIKTQLGYENDFYTYQGFRNKIERLESTVNHIKNQNETKRD